MEPAIAAAISALTSIAVALAGVWVARRKGLPTINAEIEARNAELISLLKDQVDGLRDELEDSRGEFNDCKTDLKRALNENMDLRRRVSLAENDLLTLYRESGRLPPLRLRESERGNDVG